MKIDISAAELLDMGAVLRALSAVRFKSGLLRFRIGQNLRKLAPALEGLGETLDAITQQFAARNEAKEVVAGENNQIALTDPFAWRKARQPILKERVVVDEMYPLPWSLLDNAPVLLQDEKGKLIGEQPYDFTGDQVGALGPLLEGEPSEAK